MGTQLQGPEVQTKMTGHFTITQSRNERVKGLREIFCVLFLRPISVARKSMKINAESFV